MIRRLLHAIGNAVNRMFPMPPPSMVPPLPPAETLAELEADIEVWERANGRLAPYERDLLTDYYINRNEDEGPFAGWERDLIINHFIARRQGDNRA